MAPDFIHRFLLHVLLRGFQHIRRYGLLAPEPVVTESVAYFTWRVLGVDIHRCPVCQAGRLRRVAALPRERAREPPDHA